MEMQESDIVQCSMKAGARVVYHRVSGIFSPFSLDALREEFPGTHALLALNIFVSLLRIVGFARNMFQFYRHLAIFRGSQNYGSLYGTQLTTANRTFSSLRTHHGSTLLALISCCFVSPPVT